MPTVHRYAVLAGLASGLFFLMTASGYVSGILVPFVPLIPLFWAGFRLGAYAIVHAALIALLPSLLVLGFPVAMVEFSCFILPTLLLGRQLLRARLTRQGEIEWYAAGRAMTSLVMYIAVLFLTLGYYLAGSESDLLSLLQAGVMQDTQSMDPALAERFIAFSKAYPYILISSVLCYAVLLIYGCACLANFIGQSYGRTLRASMAIEVFDPPVILPVFLFVCGLSGFFMSNDHAYLLQSTFFLLLVPYFLLGLARLHEASQHWENRRFWLGTVYVLMAFAQWPVLFFAGWGFIYHANRLGASAANKEDQGK